MIIGTVRKEEAIVFNEKQGYHSFTDTSFETGIATVEPYGSFEVFWFDGDDSNKYFFAPSVHTQRLDNTVEIEPSGWYWWSCFPGCMPDSEKVGPFASSEQAYNDANEVE